MKRSVIGFLYRPDPTMETAVTQLENINEMGIIGCWGGRVQVAALTIKRKVDKATIRIAMWIHGIS